ncbi:hypothetical protein IMG5_044040, partial [Ichthyophthirius multifiliis]
TIKMIIIIMDFLIKVYQKESIKTIIQTYKIQKELNQYLNMYKRIISLNLIQIIETYNIQYLVLYYNIKNFPIDLISFQKIKIFKALNLIQQNFNQKEIIVILYNQFIFFQKYVNWKKKFLNLQKIICIQV